MEDSPEAKLDLVALMRREYSAAKGYWFAFLLLQVASLFLAGYLIFLANGKKLIVGGVASILLPVVTVLLRRRADYRYGLGERLRRLALFENGLARTPSRTEVLEALADATVIPPVDSSPEESYFSSPLPAGAKRLAHIVEESAFYTRSLAAFTGRVCEFLAIMGVCVAFALLWFAVQANALPSINASMRPLLSNGEQLARLASTAFIFFLVGVFESLASNFRALSETAGTTFRRCGELRSQESLSEFEVALVLAAYDCALARTPPIPGMVHWLFKKRLHKAWTIDARPA